MAEDKWMTLVNDDLEDIPRKVEALKAGYWRKAPVFMMCTILGSVLMGIGHLHQLVAVGCFMAVTGMVGVFALATMDHQTLCLYRAVLEIRKNTRD